MWPGPVSPPSRKPPDRRHRQILQHIPRARPVHPLADHGGAGSARRRHRAGVRTDRGGCGGRCSNPGRTVGSGLHDDHQCVRWRRPAASICIPLKCTLLSNVLCSCFILRSLWLICCLICLKRYFLSGVFKYRKLARLLIIPRLVATSESLALFH